LIPSLGKLMPEMSHRCSSIMYTLQYLVVDY